MPSDDRSGALVAPGVSDAEWQGLAERSGNVFATQEWLGTWHRHEPAAGGFTVVQRHADGTLGALLPLALHRRRPRVLRPIGPWPPVGGPLICAEEDRAWAVSTISAQLSERRGWDVVQMFGVPSEEPWLDELSGVRLARQPSATIDIEGRSWEELLKGATSSSRRDLRRRQRRLQERYAVEFRLSDAATLHADVDTFLWLHWARWGADVNVLTPARAPFLHEFAERALSRGWLVLRLMYLDKHPVAAVLNTRFAGREVGFMTGRDPHFEADHVGLALLFHTLEQATVDGMTEFDMLRGDQPYKGRLPHRVHLTDDLALSRGHIGSLTIAAQRTRGNLQRMRSEGRTPRQVAGQLPRAGSPEQR